MISNESIVLIGMPGCGKSTLGVLLAKHLAMAFVDTDLIIQVREGERLQTIIQDKGIDYFKQLEERHICSLNIKESVIATGGSVVYSPRAMVHLSRSGIVVWLQVSLKTLLQRLGNLAARGVIIRPNQTFEELYQERQPLYERYAHLTVCCDGLNHEQATVAILQALRNVCTERSLRNS